MERRRIIFIASIIVTIVVVILVWWLLSRRATPVTLSPTPTSTANEPILPQFSAPATVLPPAQTGALVAARVWAERFASWSNEDGFTNFEPLTSLSTAQVNTFLVTYRADLTNRYPLSQGYHGQTGRALGPRMIEYSEAAGTADVQVAMQLAESTSSAPMISNRTLDLKLKKDGEAWLVDFVKWL